MTTTYRTASVDGLNVFYREAGDPKAPTMLLLHGFPTSRVPSTRSQAASCWTMYLSA
jgi:pimeloyl-ACP methyl ester carboxylesterase